MYTTINVNDHEPFIVGDSIISYTFEYIYVGSPISNATIAHQVKSHIKLKQSHVRIFTSFVSKDVDAPYKVKKVVWERALKGSIFYSCESWMYENLKSASQPYLTTQTLLLGVHSQTCTDLVVPSNKPLIWKKVSKCEIDVYIEKLENLHENPITTALYLLSLIWLF